MLFGPRQTLDFPLEERVSLAELTLALDNELLVSGNGIHQAALISYKNEIQFLQWVFGLILYTLLLHASTDSIEVMVRHFSASSGFISCVSQ